jgi:tetratricopeptide (TPR) repeat protein
VDYTTDSRQEHEVFYKANFGRKPLIYFIIERESDIMQGNPEHWCYERGEAYLYKGEQDKAIADFSKDLLRYNSRRCYADRAWAYRTKGQFDKAVADYTKLIEQNPSASLYTTRGTVYGLMDLYDDMESDYRKAIEIEPLYVVAYYRLAGLFYFDRANYSDAITYLSNGTRDRA